VTITTNSSINYLSINENFPVAGQDNDTQTFRDNFDTIKTSLSSAKTEINELLGSVARVDSDNNFGLNTIQNVLFQNVREQKLDGGAVTTSPTTIDFQSGSYQIYRVGANITVDFLNFPGDPIYTAETTPIGWGKVTLELYSDGASRIVSFSTSSGTTIKKDSSFPATLTLTSSTNPVIIEVWRHSLETIYMRYLGQFS
jgi:hypothetical protein